MRQGGGHSNRLTASNARPTWAARVRERTSAFAHAPNPRPGVMRGHWTGCNPPLHPLALSPLPMCDRWYANNGQACIGLPGAMALAGLSVGAGGPFAYQGVIGSLPQVPKDPEAAVVQADHRDLARQSAATAATDELRRGLLALHPAARAELLRTLDADAKAMAGVRPETVEAAVVVPARPALLEAAYPGTLATLGPLGPPSANVVLSATRAAFRTAPALATASTLAPPTMGLPPLEYDHALLAAATRDGRVLPSHSAKPLTPEQLFQLQNRERCAACRANVACQVGCSWRRCAGCLGSAGSF